MYDCLQNCPMGTHYSNVVCVEKRNICAIPFAQQQFYIVLLHAQKWQFVCKSPILPTKICPFLDINPKNCVWKKRRSPFYKVDTVFRQPCIIIYIMYALCYSKYMSSSSSSPIIIINLLSDL
jgi:hypothetical protein